MEKKFAERALKKLGFTLGAVLLVEGTFRAFAEHNATGSEIDADGARKLDAYDAIVKAANDFLVQPSPDVFIIGDLSDEDETNIAENNGLKMDAEHDAPKVFDGTREQWLLAFTELARSKFEEVNAPIPAIVRVSVGFPSKGVRSNAIGECWSNTGNAEGICEIFIRPSVQGNSLHLAGILTHELMHAAVGHEAGHGKKFSKPLKALGMVGKATHMVDGPEWRAWAQPLVDQLGAFPGSDLKGTLAGGKKKQGTRMLKLSCDECDFTCRSTQKHIDKIGEMRCVDPDCEGTLSTEEKEG